MCSIVLRIPINFFCFVRFFTSNSQIVNLRPYIKSALMKIVHYVLFFRSLSKYWVLWFYLGVRVTIRYTILWPRNNNFMEEVRW